MIGIIFSSLIVILTVITLGMSYRNIRRTGIYPHKLNLTPSPIKLTAEEAVNLRIAIFKLHDVEWIDDGTFLTFIELLTRSELIKEEKPLVKDDDCPGCGELFASVDDYLCPKCRDEINKPSL